MYEPTWDSVSTHPLPDWYDDAKLGIFLHWGLYSIPGWAPQVADIQELLQNDGPESMLRNNPYAEWYLNTMRIEGSPTWQHHLDTYGPDYPYDNFRPDFDAGTAHADLDAIAAIADDAGARYVVLTTKHHEGFTLWPASIPHPVKGHFHAQRDLVGDMTQAVRDRGMRMGLYYSGGYDWPFNDALLKSPADSLLAVPDTQAYRDYATAHVTELIDRYQPSVLWNDICWPAGGNLAALFAHYYNTVPDGVINDRWLQPQGNRNALTDALAKGAGLVMQALWKHLPADSKQLTFPGADWYDFNTPEYASFDDVREKKWEATRGVGHSFGANRNERPQDIVTATELIRNLCDIVSKNGNLLIGVGPDESGQIPPIQAAPLKGLGEWMRRNGEALYGTRPWHIPTAETTQNTDVRFTSKGDDVYALLLDLPGQRTFAIRAVAADDLEPVLLATGERLPVDDADGMLQLTLPERVPVEAVYAVRLGRASVLS